MRTENTDGGGKLFGRVFRKAWAVCFFYIESHDFIFTMEYRSLKLSFAGVTMKDCIFIYLRYLSPS